MRGENWKEIVGFYATATGQIIGPFSVADVRRTELREVKIAEQRAEMITCFAGCEEGICSRC